jgi:hypothetical protein
MPQSYDHGGNGTTVDWYQKELESYDKIVYGLCGEGVLTGDHARPDKPDHFVSDAKNNHAAGVFSWRLDTDSLKTYKIPEGDDQLPTFAVANRMWELMNAP